MEKGTLLKIGASVPFTVGLVGFVSYILTIYFPLKGVYILKSIIGENILWFGGVQPYSFLQFRTFSPVAADLLSVHYPLFALGPHLCGIGGFLFIADAIVRKRAWALFALSCVIVVAGINDTCGAYIYFLSTGDKGFIVPLVATTLGTCGLMMFWDCLKYPHLSIRINLSRLSGRMYLVGRALAIASTFTVMVLWIYGYCKYFLPTYLIRPNSPANFYGWTLPSLYNQLEIKLPSQLATSEDQYLNEIKSTHFFGFSVMTAQMAWAAGSVGFGISPFIAAVYGLVDRERFLRARSMMFLLYVGLISLVNVYFRVDAATEAGSLVGIHFYAVLGLYGFFLLVACGLLTVSHSRILFTAKKLD